MEGEYIPDPILDRVDDDEVHTLNVHGHTSTSTTTQKYTYTTSRAPRGSSQILICLMSPTMKNPNLAPYSLPFRFSQS